MARDRTPNGMTVDRLRAIVDGGAAAIRLRQRLQPAGGAGDKVFPPTYSGGIYAGERRRIDGTDVDAVLIDSVQSQANRFEEALLDAVEDGLMSFPLLVTNFGEQFLDVGREGKITALDAPHRIADAIFRDSLLAGKPFRESDEGRRFEAATIRNATAIFELCPTALIFGTWDSTGSKGGLGNKFPRAVVSEIVGIHAVSGVRTASRIDPLRIEKVPIYAAGEGADNPWTADVSAAAKKNNKPVPYSTKGSEKGKPSTINHGNVTPDLARNDKGEPLPGGVTIDHALQTTVLSLPTLRRLRFPTRDGNVSANRNSSARTALAALALAAIVLQRERLGYTLRSRCALVPETLDTAFEVVISGTQLETFSLDVEQACRLFADAVKAVKQADLPWRDGTIELVPKPALLRLIEASRAGVESAEE